MPDNLPARRIDRDALERIIRRAAELQAGDLDTGEGLTEQDLLKLGADVGIDGRFLRQALYEEQAGGAAAESGFLARWVGPGQVRASRVVPGDRATLDLALTQWMTDGEALTVKRRLPDATVWERQRGFFADMKRGFGVGGRRYELAKAEDVTVVVTQLEPGYCHVELIADLHDRRTAVTVAGGVGAGSLGLIGVGTVALSTVTFAPLAILSVIPLGAAALTPWLATRSFRRRSARMQLALEQVLDRLEHGEIRQRHQVGPRSGAEDVGALLLQRVGSELRRALGDGSGQPPRRLPNP